MCCSFYVAHATLQVSNQNVNVGAHEEEKKHFFDLLTYTGCLRFELFVDTFLIFSFHDILTNRICRRLPKHHFNLTILHIFFFNSKRPFCVWHGDVKWMSVINLSPTVKMAKNNFVKGSFGLCRHFTQIQWNLISLSCLKMFFTLFSTNFVSDFEKETNHIHAEEIEKNVFFVRKLGNLSQRKFYKLSFVEVLVKPSEKFHIKTNFTNKKVS